MNKPLRIALALGALAAVSVAQAGDHYRGAAPAAQPLANDAVMLVRVQRFTGIGPDGNRQALYQNDGGILLPMDEVGRVAGLVTGRGLDGAYHHLQVELAPEFTVAGAKTFHSRFNATGEPTPIDLTGAMLVMNGSARPLGVAPYYAALRPPVQTYQTARREDGRYRWHGGHDEDEDDD